jgi:hypothetical protein
MLRIAGVGDENVEAAGPLEAMRTLFLRALQSSRARDVSAAIVRDVLHELVLVHSPAHMLSCGLRVVVVEDFDVVWSGEVCVLLLCRVW